MSLLAPIKVVLEFLSDLLNNKELEYRTIAVYKSAISQAHDLVGSTTLGEHPLVSRFMKGVFKAKPPVPKYCLSWDVARVLNFLREQEPLEKISLKSLTLKLSTLLALTCRETSTSGQVKQHQWCCLNITLEKGKKKERRRSDGKSSKIKT